MYGRLFCLLSLVCFAVFLAGTSGDGAETPSARKKLTRADIDAMMTSLSNWGRWGKEDQRGALNLITPEKRKQAAALVTEGITISLARSAIKETVDDSPPFVQRMVALPKDEDITGAADEYSVRYHGFT